MFTEHGSLEDINPLGVCVCVCVWWRDLHCLAAVCNKLNDTEIFLWGLAVKNNRQKAHTYIKH